MLSYSISRILQTFFVVIGVSLLLFLLLYVFIPGDPVKLMLGPRASESSVEALREELGLNKPLYQQYFSYIGRGLKGDLGTSYRFKEPVSALVGQALPKTFQLAALAVVLELLLALIAVILSYLSKRSFIDSWLTVLSIFLISIPTFWLAMLLQYWLGLKWKILPVSGADSLGSLVMPVFTLALVSTAIIIRILKASLKETASKDYVLLARAKGLTKRQVLIKHQLKNAFIPTLTYVGMDFGMLMTGAIATEVVFNWPGVGSLMYRAIIGRDIPVILSGVLVLVVIYILVSLLIDLLYGYFNPQARKLDGRW